METNPGIFSDEYLRRIITDTGENVNVDAKRPMAFDDASEKAGLAKDIAAFANSENGGWLVIGKGESKTEPGKFDLEGVSDEQAASFETTKVAQWVNSRFSPEIRLECRRVEHDAKSFVVIRINEFHDVPVICTKQCNDPDNPRKPLLGIGCIYIRGTNAESKPLQTQDEFRQLIGVATKKRRDDFIQHFDAMLKGRPPIDKTTDQDRFNRELEKIRSDLHSQEHYSEDSGYEILFHPSTYQEERWKELAEVKQFVRGHAIARPEEFPYRQTEPTPRAWGIADSTYEETWALAKSCIFYFNKPFPEDKRSKLQRIRKYIREDTEQSNDSTVQEFLAQLENFRWIEIETALVTFIKIFALMRRFVDIFEPGEMIHYEFHIRDLRKRYLFSFHTLKHGRLLRPEYREPCSAPSLSIVRTYSVEDIIGNWQEYCVDVMSRFFELFPGVSLSRDGLMEWVRQYAGEK